MHLGHLRAAEEVLETLQLDNMLFVPAAIPPHKTNKRVLSFEHRWNMLKLAVAGNPRLQLSNVEQRLLGTSYTVNTLRKLREEIPECRLFFLLGMDSFLELITWWRYWELFGLATLVVLKRPGWDEIRVEHFLTTKISALYEMDAGRSSFRHPNFHPVILVDNTCLGISSTEIRRLVCAGKSIRYLVPDEVMRYIEENGIYRDEIDYT